MASLTTVAPHLSELVGANGRSFTIMVIAQNNDEVRATGGLPGSVGSLTMTDGKITLGSFGGMAQFAARADSGALPISDEERRIFESRLVEARGDYNFTPDFARAAGIANEYFKSAWGTYADAVVAVDPVFLQSLLKLTGGVTLANGDTVDGSNAAAYLLHDVYWKYAVDSDMDAVFADAAGLAFQQVMRGIGKADMKSLMKTLDSSVKDHRLQLYFTNADEQAAAELLGATGTLSKDETTPVLGTYVNDVTYSKIDWYLSLGTVVGPETANADGSKTYTVTTTLRNNFSPDEASVAPQYVTGYSGFKRDLSDMLTKVYIVAPAGGRIENMAVDGDIILDPMYNPEIASMNSSTNLNPDTYEGLQVYYGEVGIEGDQAATITYTVTTSPKATSALTVRSTPTLQQIAGW